MNRLHAKTLFSLISIFVCLSAAERGFAQQTAVDKLEELKADIHEDWNSLPVGTSLHAEKALVGEEDKASDFTRELLRVQWRPLDPIDVWLIKPNGVKKAPVILYLYSFPSDNARYYNTELCKALTRNGFAAVGFVSALTGPRYQNRPQKKWFISELQESLGSSVHDVQMILNYLASRGDLDMDRVGMWGDGSGASIALMAAAVDSRIKALDLLDPWGDWPDWLAKSTLVPENERADYLKPEFLDKLANLDPVKWLPQLKTEHVRLQYIENGVSVTPSLARQKIEASAGTNIQMVRYQDSKQFLSQVAAKGTGFDWIKERLGKVAAQEKSVARKDGP